MFPIFETSAAALCGTTGSFKVFFPGPSYEIGLEKMAVGYVSRWLDVGYGFVQTKALENPLLHLC